MAPHKSILILGSGSNVGAHVAAKFAANGYRVALVSRSGRALDPKYLTIKSDLSQPAGVADIFAKVKSEFGAAPNVVVHNAAALHIAPDDNPFALSQSDFESDLAVNTISTYLAAKEAVKGFETLAEGVPKSFIYTANGLNVMNLPRLVSLGVGKVASGHFLESAVLAMKGKGYTFYYADERKADGSFAYTDISGSAHAEHYWSLAEEPTQGPWMSTFVGGIGYKYFPLKEDK